MVTRPVIASTASTIMVSWPKVRGVKCGLSMLRVAMISFMVRLGLDAGCCDELRILPFLTIQLCTNNYAFAIVRPTGIVESH